MAYRVLLVDDVEFDRDITKSKLKSMNDIELVVATSGDEAVRLVKARPNAFALILLDLNMPHKNGIETAREIFAINKSLLVAVFSNDDSREALRQVVQLGSVVDFIDKVTDEETLISKVRGYCKKFEEEVRVIEPLSTRSQNQQVIENIGLVGVSRAMAEVARIVKKAAPSDTTVLIRGESGTGKEGVAHALHNLSPRKSSPFIAINMAAITSTLIESELFGHKKGAFTGAIGDKAGRFKIANGGTIFLDEIGDLSPDLQAKLLRVLQERVITPVGSNENIPINVRVIAATHVDLEKAIKLGTFREDLYYRLNVLPIVTPPLRERPEDIRPLISHFLNKFSGGEKHILVRASKLLERYPWPGNVRELESEIEKLVSLVGCPRIEPHHLDPKYYNAIETTEKVHELDVTFEEFMKSQVEREKKFLMGVLSRSQSFRDAAKHRLKVSPSTLHGRVKKLGIDVSKETNEEGEVKP